MKLVSKLPNKYVKKNFEKQLILIFNFAQILILDIDDRVFFFFFKYFMSPGDIP